MSRTITRRSFLTQSALVGIGLAAAACGKPAQPAPAPAKAEPTKAPAPTAAPVATKAPEPTAAPAATKAAAPTAAPAAAAAGKYKEAPALAELVKAGKLPPVDQRLPKNPKLVNEMPEKFLKLEVGKYGGVIRTASTSPTFDAEAFCAQNEPLINTPAVLGEEFYPNILETYSISPDFKEYTFKLREGLKWSDGKPVTTADVSFAIEDVLFNKEITNDVPTWLKAGNNPKSNPPKYDKVDDFTWKMTFDEPYGGFEYQVAVSGWRSYVELLKPAHYLKPFHKKYAEEAKLKAEIEKIKVETWVQLFTRKDITNWEFQQQDALEFPRLYPWLLTALDKSSITCERNHYYFKVDAAGQQLPYLDKLIGQILADVETQALKIMAGEVDFSARFATLVKMPLYKENEKNGYKVQIATDHVTHSDVFLNQTYKDENWRTVVRNKKFRQALNMAIDRKEVLDAVYYGYADMPTWVPSEFDPKKAMQILDEIGLNKKDSEGFRLGPDGKTFLIPFEYATQDPTFQPCVQIIAENWKAIGLKTTLKVIDNALWGQRNAANELQATMLWAWPIYYGGDLGQNRWCPLWWRWIDTRGRDGEEPPAEIKAMLEMLLSVGGLPPKQALQRLEEVKKLHYDLICWMPPLENIRQPMIINAKYGNVPQTDKVMGIAVDFAAEQLYMKS